MNKMVDCRAAAQSAETWLHPEDPGSTTRNTSHYRSFLTLTAIGLAVSCALSAAEAREAPPTRKISFDINAPALVQALMQFTQQSGLQLMVPTGTATEVPAPRVIGSYTPTAALDQLLAGTPFKYEFANPRTVAVRISEDPAPSSSQADALTEDDSSATRPTQAKTSLPLDEKGTDEDKADRRAAESEVPKRGMPEVLVKGSRSTNVDIRRTQDDVQPYVVFDRRQIERSQAASLEDFLKAQLPMNTAAGTLDQLAGTPNQGTGNLNLRGLGANQTLVLVDGRRIASVANVAGSFGQPNISGIPLAAIERIEVLPATAGAIYGGSATGGVINIIRKRDYAGLDLQAKYGNTFEGDVSNVEYSLNGGSTFFRDRTHIAFSAVHSKSGELLVDERDFARRSRALQLENVPTAFASLSRPVAGTTTNFCAGRQLTANISICTRTPLTLDNGQALGTYFGSVPGAYAGPISDNGAALLGTAGTYNLDVPHDGQYLLRSPVRTSLSVNVRQSLGERFELLLDGLRSRSESDLSSGAGSQPVFLTATAANNPFQQGVVIAVPVMRLRRPGRSESDVLSGAASVIARLPGDWAASLEQSWSRTRYSFDATLGNLISDQGIDILRAAAFRGTPLSVADLSGYVVSEPNSFSGPFETNLRGTGLRLSGTAAHLPAGPLSLTALVEHREEAASTAFAEDTVGTTSTFTLFPPRYQSTDSYYMEARVPLASGDQGFHLVDQMELQASVRHDKYETTSTTNLVPVPSRSGPFSMPDNFNNDVSSTDYLLGVRYAPVRDITVRASIGTGFLPPGLDLVTRSISTVPVAPTVTDPLRGNTGLVVPYTQVAGGNPDLQPESSRSTSIGVIVTPGFINGLRFSADYTRIKKSSEILTVLPLQTLLDNETLFQGRITRGPNLPTDASGWAGPITKIDISPVNIFAGTVSAIDLQMDYHWQTGKGDVSFSVVATQMREFQRQIALNVGALDYVGYLNGPLRWKGISNLSWERGPWTASWNTQYYDSYLVNAPGPSSRDASNPNIIRQGSAAIRSQLYHDLFIKYRFGSVSQYFLANTTIALGVQNVFNSSPPILAPLDPNSIGAETYSFYGDPRLRRYAFSIQKSFGK